MSWKLTVAKSAARKLKRFPPRDRARIAEALRKLAYDPLSAPGVERLRAHDPAPFRMRVGAYRILFDVLRAEARIEAHDIARRTTTTYRRRR